MARFASWMALTLIIGVTAYFFYDTQYSTSHRVELGNVVIPGSQAGRLVALHQGGVAPLPSLGNWDTLQQAGAAYRVPAGATLQVAKLWLKASTSTEVTYSFGYSTGAVANATSTPAGVVTLWYQALPATGAVFELDPLVQVPERMYPWIRAEAAVAGAWPGPVTVNALREP